MPVTQPPTTRSNSALRASFARRKEQKLLTDGELPVKNQSTNGLSVNQASPTKTPMPPSKSSAGPGVAKVTSGQRPNNTTVRKRSGSEVSGGLFRKVSHSPDHDKVKSIASVKWVPRDERQNQRYPSQRSPPLLPLKREREPTAGHVSATSRTTSFAKSSTQAKQTFLRLGSRASLFKSSPVNRSVWQSKVRTSSPARSGGGRHLSAANDQAPSSKGGSGTMYSTTSIKQKGLLKSAFEKRRQGSSDAQAKSRPPDVSSENSQAGRGASSEIDLTARKSPRRSFKSAHTDSSAMSNAVSEVSSSGFKSDLSDDDSSYPYSSDLSAELAATTEPRPLLTSSDEERSARARMSLDNRWKEQPMEGYIFNYPRKLDDSADRSFELRVKMFESSLKNGDASSAVSSGGRSTYTSSENS